MSQARTTTLMLAIAALAGVAIGCGGGDKKPPPRRPRTGGGPARPDEGGGGEPAAAAFDASRATASISVTATGPATKRRPLAMDADPLCGDVNAGALDEAVVVNDGKVQNVIVWVSKGADAWSFDVPSEPVVLDQNGCTYVPHAFTMMAGQEIVIRNSDPTTHNVHAVPDKKGANRKVDINDSQLKGAPDLRATIDGVEESGFYFKCDIHGWMKSWAGIFAHPFHGVTGEDGTVTLPRLPPGEFTVSVWHEKLKVPGAQTVTLKDGETKTLEFALTK